MFSPQFFQCIFCLLFTSGSPDVTYVLEWTPPDIPAKPISDLEALCSRILEQQADLDNATKAAVLYRRFALRGQLLEMQSKAVEDIEEAYRLHPENADIIVSYARTRVGPAGIRELKALADKLIVKQGNRPHGFFLAGLYYYSRNDYGLAVENLTQALSRDPEMTSAMVWRAVCNLNLHRFEDAARDVKAGLLMRPTLPKDYDKLYGVQGQLLAKDGEYRKAIPVLHRELQSLPDAYGARGILWNCYRECGYYESALRIAVDDVAAHPKESQAHSRLACSLAHAGDLDGALDHAVESISLDNDNHINWKVAARVFAARGAFQDAIAALKHGPADAESSVLASFLYASADDDRARNGKTAVRIHEATARVFPNPVPPHLNLVGACCYAEAGNFDKAVELAQSAVEQSPAGSPIETSARHLLNLFQNRQPYRLDRDRALRPFDLPVLEHIIPKGKAEVAP